ncbi:MAG: transcriptional repressor [Actinomycetota bacterium]|nr:transcriptional repressor [Actinomycetota bacterium]
MASVYGEKRTSPQRERIAAAVDGMSRAFTIEELARRVRARDTGTAVATVYRAVAAMEDSGYLARVGESGGHALYARCVVDDHHHHLVCTECGAVAHAACPLDAGVLASVERQGFVITRHEITMYGLCRTCRRGVAEAS